MKVAVVGSRTFNDYSAIKRELDYYAKEIIIDCIISGGAKGVDQLAEIWARENNVAKMIFYPDWEGQGKSAGFIRNRKIIENADLVIAFWDGRSKGTGHSINLARQQKKPLRVIITVSKEEYFKSTEF